MLKGVPSTDEEEETVEISSSHLRDSQVEKKQIFASDSNQIKEYTDKIKNLEHLLLNQETIIQEDHSDLQEKIKSLKTELSHNKNNRESDKASIACLKNKLSEKDLR